MRTRRSSIHKHHARHDADADRGQRVTLDAEGKPVKYADQNIAKGMDPAHVAELMLASCENNLWEVWLVTPGVELALYVNQYVPLLMPVLASLAKKHAQAATGGKYDTLFFENDSTMSAPARAASPALSSLAYCCA